MDESFSFDVSKKTIEKILERKKETGFLEKSWDDWFSFLLGYNLEENSTQEIIEKVCSKNNYQAYYDNWIRNFSINLEHIWDERSARELSSTVQDKKSSAIVIGRGPSIIKKNHLKMLAESSYDGNVVCSDGSLATVLDAGVTPDKFKNFFVVTIDSQDHQKRFYEHDSVFQYGEKIKCILSTTTSPLTYEVIKKARMERYWLHTLVDYDKGNSSFNYISSVMAKSKNHERGLPAIQTGGNVGTSAWIISWSLLKCSTVCLVGFDMGYPVDIDLEKSNFSKNFLINYRSLKFPEGVSEDDEIFKKAYPIIYNPEFNCQCRQDPTFQYYCNALKEFIFKTSNKIKTVNATEGGALFGEGVKCMKFRDFLQECSV